MRWIVTKIPRIQIMQVVPKASLGALPMFISLELGFSLLAGYFVARYVSSTGMVIKVLGAALFLILLDELLREGYLFNPADILVLRMTHEKAFLGLFVMGIAAQGYQNFKVNSMDQAKGKAA